MKIKPMSFGAYFIPDSEWPDAIALGLTYCVWPIIVPDIKGDGDGFVADKKIVNMRTGVWHPYPVDECQNPRELREKKGSFITLGRQFPSQRVVRPDLLNKKYQRGIVNYFLPSDDWRNIEVGVLTAHACAKAWAGGPWTAVINANSGGLLDRASEEKSVPTYLLVEQADWYAELGATRIFWWRWDTPKGFAAICKVMKRIQDRSGTD